MEKIHEDASLAAETKTAEASASVEEREFCNLYEAPVLREVDPAGVLYAVLN